MRLFTAAAVVVSLAAPLAAQQTSKAVLDHHVMAVKQGNVDMVMADYADDAVLITPHGIVPGQTDVSGNDVFAGKTNIRKFFVVLGDKDHLPDVKSMEATFQTLGSDVTLMRWVQYKGTPKEVRGTDTWVIRNGKVIFQMVAVEPAKK
jgi:hypothetical protein